MGTKAENIRANEILRDKFESRGYMGCEVRLEGCTGTWGLSFAHRKKRRFYKTVEELSDINEVVMACLNCHQKLEVDKDLTREIFKRLRPDS